MTSTGNGRMHITLNGNPRELDAESPIPQLIATLNVKPEQVAIAINGQVVRRVDWPATTIREGDTVEVVRAVGGG